MKITVICAAGRQGRKLVTEALNRGHKVTAVVRKGNESPVGADVIEKDLFDLTLSVRGQKILCPSTALLSNICVIFFPARISVC